MIGSAHMNDKSYTKSKKLNISFVIGSLDTGGAEKQIILLAKGLMEAGHTVQIATILESSVNGKPSHFPDMNNLHTTPKKIAGRSLLRNLSETLKFALVFFKYLIVNKPDVVHAWLLHSYLIAMPVAFLAKVPVRISARRGMWNAIDAKIWLHFSKISNLFATYFTANSIMVREDASSVETIPIDKFEVIVNIVSPETRRANVLSQPAKIVVVANLISYKGHLDLLEAICLMEDSLQFTFIGEGPMRETLILKAEELGISSRVNFLGYQEKPIDFMLKSQFGVLPSHSEGMPNVILEAQSIGLPMISTKVGGVPEVLIDSINGYLVNPHSPLELADAITKMSCSPDIREKMGIAGLSTVKKYSPEMITRQYVEMYIRLIGDCK